MTPVPPPKPQARARATPPADQVGLALDAVEALPTPPLLAGPLMRAATADVPDPDRLLALVRVDPALSLRVLAEDAATTNGADADDPVGAAVERMGVHGLRDLVLAIRPGEAPQDALWLQQAATACCASKLWAHHQPTRHGADTGFTLGLLRGVGALAMLSALPRAWPRAAARARSAGLPLAEVERAVFGLDHGSAGKRLCERWRLPHRVTRAAWLAAMPASGAAGVPIGDAGEAARLALAAATADASGVGAPVESRPLGGEPLAHLTRLAGVSEADLERLRQTLPQEVRGLMQGLRLTGPESAATAAPPDAEVYRRACRVLAEGNGRLRRRAAASVHHAEVMRAIAAFQAPGDQEPPAASEQGSCVGIDAEVDGVLGRIAASVVGLWGTGYLVALRPEEGGGWRQLEFAAGHDRPAEPAAMTTTATATTTATMGAVGPGVLPPPQRFAAAAGREAPAAHLADEFADVVGGAADLRRLRVLVLGTPRHVEALLLHDRDHGLPEATLRPLAAVWAGALASARHHTGARRAAERLAAAHASLATAQREVAEAQSMKRLGEMAAGAAHEMNNPLTVISGRAEQLLATLDPDANAAGYAAAAAVHRQAQRLSDMISGLRLFADPPVAARRPVDLTLLLRRGVDRAAEAAHRTRPDLHLDLQLPPETDTLRRLALDPEQIAAAVGELLDNAVQAEPATGVSVRAWLEDASLWIRVSDDGRGMDEHTLRHATDPYFSQRTAGRRVGLGLSRVQQFSAAHGGTIQLTSTPGQRTTATLRLPLNPPGPAADTPNQAGPAEAAARPPRDAAA